MARPIRVTDSWAAAILVSATLLAPTWLLSQTNPSRQEPAGGQVAPGGQGGQGAPGGQGPGGPGPGAPGFGGPGFGGPGFGGPGGGPMGGQELKLVKQFDKDNDKRLNREERDKAREFLQTERASGRRGGFGPGGPGGGPGGPGGRGPGGPRLGRFGPGQFMGAALLETLDKNQDKHVSTDEWSEGIKRFFKDNLVDGADSLDEARLAAGIGRILPPPPGFGPGGQGPGGQGPGGQGPGGQGPAGPGPGAQPPGGPAAGGQRPGGPGPGGQGPGGQGPGGPGFGGPGFGGPGFGGPGGPFRFDPGAIFATALLARADQDKNGRVTLAEATPAADKLFQESDKDKDAKLNETEMADAINGLMPQQPGFGPPGGFGRENREPAKPGPKVAVEDVQSYPNAELYEPTVLRTLFLTFDQPDWETEMADFNNTDVEIPARLVVDGKEYPNVGVHFRGMSSFGMVPAGYKRSLNVALDFVDPKQRLYGYKTLNLLNAHGDSSLMSTVLYSHIARPHIPAPKSNFVKVVINGESWGVYVNVQQFNKEFLAENYPTTNGSRWKVQGSPGGGGGLEYLGDNIDDYRRRYQIKSADNEEAWRAFVNLCRVLNTTPADQLEAALRPILDVDGLLWFLALDVALINNDGYWVRASDYSLYLDEKGVFHVVPHDMNEAFHGAMMMGMGGPGGRGGPGGPGGFGPAGPGGFGPGGFGPRGGGGGGVSLDPLVALDDARKPLRSKVLAVPALRTKYLEHVREIADKSLDWKQLGPTVTQLRQLIEKEVELDTRKLSSADAFRRATADATAARPQGGPGEMSLRDFAEQRRAYLLAAVEKALAAPSPAKP